MFTTAALAGACAIALAAPDSSGVSPPKHNGPRNTSPRLASTQQLVRAAALREAEAMLAEASLPPGAQREASEPAGADGALSGIAGPSPLTPLLVRAHAFWVVPTNSRSVFDWALSHKPANANSSGETDNQPPPSVSPGIKHHLPSSSPPSIEEVFYGWHSQSGPVLERGLAIAVVPSSEGPSYVRGEAYVVPRLPRPAAERIPTAARILRITAREPLRGHGRKASSPITLENGAKLREIAHMIDALPRAQPGTYSCPMDNGSSVTFTFRARAAGPVLALVNAQATGCGSVSMEIEGRRYPGLREGSKLIRKVEKLLGRRAAQLPRPL